MNVLIHCVHCGAFCIVFLFRVIVQLSVSFQIRAAPMWFCRIPIVPQTHLSHQTSLPWRPLLRQAMAVCAECQLTRGKKERKTHRPTDRHTHTHTSSSVTGWVTFGHLKMLLYHRFKQKTMISSSLHCRLPHTHTHTHTHRLIAVYHFLLRVSSCLIQVN